MKKQIHSWVDWQPVRLKQHKVEIFICSHPDSLEADRKVDENINFSVRFHRIRMTDKVIWKSQLFCRKYEGPSLRGVCLWITKWNFILYGHILVQEYNRSLQPRCCLRKMYTWIWMCCRVGTQVKGGREENLIHQPTLWPYDLCTLLFYSGYWKKNYCTNLLD